VIDLVHERANAEMTLKGRDVAVIRANGVRRKVSRD
jgi:hypothetical protein